MKDPREVIIRPVITEHSYDQMEGNTFTFEVAKDANKVEIRQAIEAMELPCLGKTRGLGMMIGIDVVGEQTNSQLAAKLIESGLLILTAGPGLRLLPPLTITQEEMDKGLAIMKAALL